MSGTQLFTAGVARAFFRPATRSVGGPVIKHFHSSLHQAEPRALATAVRSVLLERTALVVRLPLIQAPALVVAGIHDDMYPITTQH